MRITLCGPIEYWWGERWETPERERYFHWRDQVSAALVEAGHLVYRPHEAFKGMWDANDGDAFGQRVNDAAILCSEVVLFLGPAHVPSAGCDDERDVCRAGTILDWPPPDPYTPIAVDLLLAGLISTLEQRARRV